MSVRGPLPGLLLVSLTGCTHTVPCTVTSAEPVAPAAASSAVVPPPPPVVLLDVGWQLRSDDGATWSEAPPALHTFSSGRWECALGEVLPADSLTDDALELQRTRRLACTHATGATVQTQLTCSLREERTRSSRPVAPPEARELQLKLDATPEVHVRCAPAEVHELSLLSRDRRSIALLCTSERGITECAKTGRVEPTESVAPTPH